MAGKIKNILFFQRSISLDDGGVPRVSDVISTELSNRGYKCHFVYFEKDNTIYPPSVILKIDLKNTYSEIEKSVLQFIKQHEINFFVCQNTYLPPFIKLFKSIRRLYPNYPFLCFLHASPDYWKSSYSLKTKPFKSVSIKERTKELVKKVVFKMYNPYVKTTSSLYNICDKFILLSDSFKEDFIKLYHTKSVNKLSVISNPLTYHTSLSQNELVNKKKTVLIVSRLKEHQKRISTALKIWQKISDNPENDWELLIVGSGPDESFYKKLVRDKNIKNVVFAGHKSDVVSYYQQASILLMTSIWEGFPMSLLEGQQNGVVPIAFDNFSAIYDIISDAENGFIIQDNCVERFTERLASLMQDETLRNDMACKSIESSQRFHVIKVVNKWEQLLSNHNYEN